MSSGLKRPCLRMIMKVIPSWRRPSRQPWSQPESMSTHVSSTALSWVCLVDPNTLNNSLFPLSPAGYGFKTLLEKKCADILQPDITWCGGMTEARRIVALASAYDIPIIPHGSSIYSYHLQICFPSCPMAEFLVMSPKADSIGALNLFFCALSDSTFVWFANPLHIIRHYIFSIFLWWHVYWRAIAKGWICWAAR